jgi:hypothetical protein
MLVGQLYFCICYFAAQFSLTEHSDFLNHHRKSSFPLSVTLLSSLSNILTILDHTVFIKCVPSGLITSIGIAISASFCI